MRRILLMVQKDLRRRARAPLAVLPMLLFPLIFALLIALVFGGSGQKAPKIRLLVENDDGDGLVSRLIVGAFGSDRMTEYFETRQVAKGEGRALMEQGAASALLLIPERFSRDLIDGRQTRLLLVRNPAESILPEAAEEVTRTLAELLSAAARVLRGPLDRLGPMLDADRSPSDASIASLSVAFSGIITKSGKYIFPPAIELETGTVEPAGGKKKASDTFSVFLFILPGISVFCLFMLGDQTMRDILTEGSAGTLRRQLSGPVGAGTVVAAKAIGTAVISALVVAILSVAGWWAAPAGVSAAGFVALSGALVVSVAGYAAVVYGLARSERQGATLGSLVCLVMGFAGGAFIPLDSLPAGLRRLSPFTLFYWGTNGYRKILFDHGGLADVLTEIAVLAVAGSVLLAVGALLLGRKIRAGGAA
jgi:ABC-type multidrug transport system permease subunit